MTPQGSFRDSVCVPGTVDVTTELLERCRHEPQAVRRIPRGMAHRRNLLFPGVRAGCHPTRGKALKDGKVEAAITGMGGSTGDAILLTVRQQVPDLLVLTLTPGTVFKSNKGTVQNMAGAAIKGEHSFGGNSYRPAAEIVLADNDKHGYIVEALLSGFSQSQPKSLGFLQHRLHGIRKRQRFFRRARRRAAPIQAIQAALRMGRGYRHRAKSKSTVPVDDGDIAVAKRLLQDARHCAKAA